MGKLGFKQIIAITLVMCLAVGLITVFTMNTVITYAYDEIYETESNNKINEANVIALQTSVSGVIENWNDVDWFTFTLPRDGVIWITFNHDNIDSESDYWSTALYTNDNREMVEYKWKGKTLEVDMVTGKIGLPTGTYSLKIRRGKDQSNLPYTFIVNYAESSGWEKESNGIVVHANKISTNSLIHGSVMKAEDKDWYAFDLLSSGKIRIFFKHTYIDSDSYYWNWSLCNSENRELKSGKITGKPEDVFSDTFSLIPGEYYLCISRGNVFCDGEYAFSVDYSVEGNFIDEHIDHDNLIIDADYLDSSEQSDYYVDNPISDVKTSGDDIKLSGIEKKDPLISINDENEEDAVVKVGTVFSDGTFNYKVTYDQEVTIIGLKDKNASQITVPSLVKYNEITFGVVEIAKKAFTNNKNITRVIISADLDTIGESAFSGCTEITRLDITGNITEILRKAFYKCKKLSQIYIATEYIEEIGKKAFARIDSSVRVKVPKDMKKDYTSLLNKGGLPTKASIKE